MDNYAEFERELAKLFNSKKNTTASSKETTELEFKLTKLFYQEKGETAIYDAFDKATSRAYAGIVNAADSLKMAAMLLAIDGRNLREDYWTRKTEEITSVVNKLYEAMQDVANIEP